MFVLKFQFFGELLLKPALFRTHFVPEAWQVVNLVATTLIVGGMMQGVGRWRARRGDSLLRIDRFAYGNLIALSLGVIRFLFGA